VGEDEITQENRHKEWLEEEIRKARTTTIWDYLKPLLAVGFFLTVFGCFRWGWSPLWVWVISISFIAIMFLK
jgi:hypothetical protein